MSPSKVGQGPEQVFSPPSTSKPAPEEPNLETQLKSFRSAVEAGHFDKALQISEKLPETEKHYQLHSLYMQKTMLSFSQMCLLTNANKLTPTKYSDFLKDFQQNFFTSLKCINAELKANKKIPQGEFDKLEAALNQITNNPELFYGGTDKYFSNLYQVLARNNYKDTMSRINFIIVELYGSNPSNQNQSQFKISPTKESSRGYIECENIYRNNLKQQGLRDNGFKPTLEGGANSTNYPDHFIKRQQLFESIFKNGKMPESLNEFKSILKNSLDKKTINQTQVLQILDYFIKQNTSYRMDRFISGGVSDEFLLKPEEFYKTKTGDCDDYAMFIRDTLKELKMPVAFISVPGHALTVCRADNKWYVVDEREGLNEGSYPDVSGVLEAVKKMRTGTSSNPHALQVHSPDLNDLGLPSDPSQKNSHPYATTAGEWEMPLTPITTSKRNP